MNELDLAVAVFLSSGAGYLVGKHYERKKAQAAFKSFQKQVIMSTQTTTAGIMDAVMKRLPDLDMPAFMKDIVESCKAAGVDVIAVNPKTGHVVKADDNKAQ